LTWESETRGYSTDHSSTLWYHVGWVCWSCDPSLAAFRDPCYGARRQWVARLLPQVSINLEFKGRKGGWLALDSRAERCFKFTCESAQGVLDSVACGRRGVPWWTHGPPPFLVAIHLGLTPVCGQVSRSFLYPLSFRKGFFSEKLDVLVLLGVPAVLFRIEWFPISLSLIWLAFLEWSS
jgi:hypothetical protein